MAKLSIFLLVIFTLTNFQNSNCDEEENLSKLDRDFWTNLNRKEILKRIENLKKTFGEEATTNILEKKPKNVIFFMGDGMGMSTITSARWLNGYNNGVSPEENSFTFENFPSVSLSKAYSLDKMVTDSAAAATSYHCGTKTNYNLVGVSGQVIAEMCSSSLNESTHVDSFMRWTQIDRNMYTGFVTTAEVTHASPSPIYAHSAYRKWTAQAVDGCDDIAKQLVESETGRNLRVILGGGKDHFIPKTCGRKKKKCFGERSDGRYLIDSWLESKTNENVTAKYVSDKFELSEMNIEETDFLLGLFSDGHMEYNLERENKPDEPSLSEMVTQAIKLLQKGPEGFTLFVEGGKIDIAHHKNKAQQALDETIQLDKAVKVALQLTNDDDTLIIVTADHSHSLTLNGYLSINESILSKTDDGYTALLYATGPGPDSKRKRIENTTHPLYASETVHQKKRASHTGEDLPVYVSGPGANLFSGVYDQTYIAHAISFLTCSGPQKNLC